MKKMNISSVNLNSNNNTVLVTEEGGTLILHSYSDDEEGQKPKYQTQYCTRNEELYVYIQLSGKGNGNGSPNNEGNQKLKHQAQYRKGTTRETPERPPKGPPERLGPVKENPGFEKFEVSSDNESDGKIYNKNEKKYLDDKAVNLDLGDLDLMLQILPRIYRLLQVSNGNWVLLDVFEEITPTFFKKRSNYVRRRKEIYERSQA
ncbi:hypothetical protein C1646_777194 [Rhizophagus diaphanus]|nr:hypothetical protein C1646_777194 [Rhizophagus diaphanus] [Rhizophagus sp. MUCL 43196]